MQGIFIVGTHEDRIAPGNLIKVTVGDHQPISLGMNGGVTISFEDDVTITITVGRKSDNLQTSKMEEINWPHLIG